MMLNFHIEYLDEAEDTMRCIVQAPDWNAAIKHIESFKPNHIVRCLHSLDEPVAGQEAVLEMIPDGAGFIVHLLDEVTLRVNCDEVALYSLEYAGEFIWSNNLILLLSIVRDKEEAFDYEKMQDVYQLVWGLDDDQE